MTGVIACIYLPKINKRKKMKIIKFLLCLIGALQFVFYITIILPDRIKSYFLKYAAGVTSSGIVILVDTVFIVTSLIVFLLSVRPIILWYFKLNDKNTIILNEGIGKPTQITE